MQVSLTHERVKGFAKDGGCKRRQAADQFFKGGTDFRGLIFAVLSFLLLLMSEQAWAVGFTFTTINVPGARLTEAFGINDSGQIVGSFVDSLGTHGFLQDGATFTTIDVPGAPIFLTSARGINDSGQIVGDFPGGFGRLGFLKDGATFTSFNFDGADLTLARGINNSGQIIGTGILENGQPIGFLKSGATFTTIGVPGAEFETQAFGINDSGQIVGAFSDSSGTHGFLATPVPEPSALFLLAAGLAGLGMAAWKRRGKSFL